MLRSVKIALLPENKTTRSKFISLTLINGWCPDFWDTLHLIFAEKFKHNNLKTMVAIIFCICIVSLLDILSKDEENKFFSHKNCNTN